MELSLPDLAVAVGRHLASVRRVMEVVATAPPYPSESDLAAAEVAPCAWGRSGGRMRHLLASRPQSPVAAVRAALPCWIR
uniref:Uncharacterized protein n=1 Tax=Oryza nivara TaxID=4536 RepID=A0A0E0GXG0_ORYNI